MQGSKSIILLLLIAQTSLGQIQGDTVYIGNDKATYINIEGTTPIAMDGGGRDSLINFVQVTNTMTIRLTPRKIPFPPTNFLISCADTTFLLNILYTPNPTKTKYTFVYNNNSHIRKGNNNEHQEPKDTITAYITQKDLSVPLQNIKKCRTLSKNLTISNLSNKILFLLDNIAVDDNYIYLKLRVKNKSKVDYRIDYLNLETSSIAKRMKATTKQILYPVYVEDPENIDNVQSGKEATLVYALQKFALRDDEIMYLTIFERSTNTKGRVLKLRVKSSMQNNIIRL